MNRLINDSQKRAIESLDRNVMVRAGAGTGKTTVLVERYVNIISGKRANCSEILAITFTDKAANEMKCRLVDAFQERGLMDARRELENSYIGTIHSFCSRILKEHPIEAGIDPDFQVMQEEESNLLKEKALDHLIEERFSRSDVSDLLRGYTELRIRKDLKLLHGTLLTGNVSLGSLTSTPTIIDEEELKQRLVCALNEVAAKERQRPQAEETILFLNQSNELNWELIEHLEILRKKFNFKGTKDKAESKIAMSLFETFLQLQIEKLGAPFRVTFSDLLSEFEKRYEILKREKACFDFSDLQRKAIQLLSSEHAAGKAVREHYRRRFKFIMVDEFQDVDSLELQLINLLKSEDNLFVVGDSKQSIYGFRGSDPSIFERMTREAEENQRDILISLTDNYRTRQETLQFINPFFNSIWKANSGIYDELRASKHFENAIEVPVDVIEIKKETGDLADETRLEEARTIVMRIKELIRTEGFRFGDFAMLFRSGKSMPLYEQEFRNAQIPYYVIGGEGFFNRPEIRDVLNVLRILENPKKDIPLAAILRSPMFCVSDDSLFWISRFAKAADKTRPFYHGVFECEAISELSESELSKVIRFRKLFDAWLQAKTKVNIAELMEQILTDTHYDLYVLGLPQGKRQFANLRKLIDLARNVGSKEALHLGDFIRLVEGFETNEARESEAQVQAEEGNVVRFLTIHKAKGLEFKCVVLPDLSRGAPRLDQSFVYHPEQGIGMKVYQPKTGDLKESLSFKKIKEELKVKAIEESKRLLYVAMTRAEERLILAGTAKAGKEDDGSEGDGEESANWFDWVRSKVQEENFRVNFVAPVESSLIKHEKRSRIAFPAIRAKIETLLPIRSEVETGKAALLINPLKSPEILFFDRIDLPVSAYHAFMRDSTHEEYRATYELGAKQPLSDLKREEPAKEDLGLSISPAEFGTLLHSIFESLIYRNPVSESKLQETIHFFARHESKNVLAQLTKAATSFLKSQLFSEIKSAKNIYSEIPFSLRLKYGIVHGTLDLLYQTKQGEWVILDYKTSNVTERDLIAKAAEYRPQMEFYALASREILEIIPARATLYFTKPDQTYDFAFKPSDFEVLKKKYKDVQKEVLEYRKQLKLLKI